MTTVPPSPLPVLPEALRSETQPIRTTQEAAAAAESAAARSQDEVRTLKLLEFDLRCRQLTGFPIKKASISIGRLLNYHWHSLLEVDPMLRAALLPICDCTPRRLQQCMTLMLKRYPDPRGTMRWAMHLLGQLAPVLDWEVVLAYARFADPTVAEHALTKRPRPDGSQADAPRL